MSCRCIVVRAEVMVTLCVRYSVFFFFKQKTAYEMRISDWSSDVCSSDLDDPVRLHIAAQARDLLAECAVRMAPVIVELLFRNVLPARDRREYLDAVHGGCSVK